MKLIHRASDGRRGLGASGVGVCIYRVSALQDVRCVADWQYGVCA